MTRSVLSQATGDPLVARLNECKHKAATFFARAHTLPRGEVEHALDALEEVLRVGSAAPEADTGSTKPNADLHTLDMKRAEMAKWLSAAMKHPDNFIEKLSSIIYDKANENPGGLAAMPEQDFIDALRRFQPAELMGAAIFKAKRNMCRAMSSFKSADGKIIETGDYKLRYGPQSLLEKGLEAFIGPPTGDNESQITESVRQEHTDVAPQQWGASDREFSNSNYNVRTTPRREYVFSGTGSWESASGLPTWTREGWAPGKFDRVDMGGETVEQEVVNQRRRWTSPEEILDTLSAKINASRREWANELLEKSGKSEPPVFVSDEEAKAISEPNSPS